MPSVAVIRLVVVVGIRSQFIKLASFLQGVEDWNARNGREGRIRVITVNSGQHYSPELAKQYHETFGTEFDFDLTGQHGSLEPEFLLGSMIRKLTATVRRVTDVAAVIVFGDANTTLAGAVAAKAANLPLVHVEAGLRTYTDTVEEANRTVVDRLADLHIASCQLDYDNLLTEGFWNSSLLVGDVVRDLVAPGRTRLASGQSTVVITLHREENIEDSTLVERVFRACREQGLRGRFYAHPRLLEVAQVAASRHQDIEVFPSCTHDEMVRMVSESAFVVTDSGALQRESYYLGRRSVVVQKVPLWRSLVDGGIHRRCDGTDDCLAECMQWAVTAPADFGQPVFFGGGTVALDVVSAVVRFVAGRSDEEVRLVVG